MVSAMQAADKLDLKAITSGEFAASYVTGINPIDGTDLYASISNDGKQVISYSFKTGKQMSILFDVNAAKAPSMVFLIGFTKRSSASTAPLHGMRMELPSDGYASTNRT